MVADVNLAIKTLQTLMAVDVTKTPPIHMVVGVNLAIKTPTAVTRSPAGLVEIPLIHTDLELKSLLMVMMSRLPGLEAGETTMMIHTDPATRRHLTVMTIHSDQATRRHPTVMTIHSDQATRRHPMAMTSEPLGMAARGPMTIHTALATSNPRTGGITTLLPASVARGRMMMIHMVRPTSSPHSVATTIVHPASAASGPMKIHTAQAINSPQAAMED
ncbi:hypothetical protein EJ08DRAFT_131991 [Tothia fuscella]|uniref:Uncharacterized protein n=1 Tax=Tothia fuscella TaxID=1048955 RepID=A0A9P4NVD5_9PEZI|nr:hypothetical protein EJ08DRAFT_131991 [Tothia fuscella]